MKQVFENLVSMLKDGDTVVLGCSGGPDSMALFDLLLKVRKNTAIKIVCAHVNHKQRKESDEEEVWLANFCKKKRVSFEKMIIENYGDDNFHNEARNIRYNFFEGLVEKYNAKYLVTAHHGDDLIETVLMRIVRGSTLRGYSGFSEKVKKDGYTIIRPLITVTKSEIEDYCKKNKLEYAVDKSNYSDKYTRNRYRKTVLPFLKSEDENVHLKFLKYSKVLETYSNYLDEIESTVIKKVYKKGKIDIEKFKELDSVVQNGILNKILEEYYEDDLILISDVHTDLIKDLIHSRKANAIIYLPNEIKVIKSYDNVSFERETDQIDSYEIELLDYANLPNGKNIKRVDKTDNNSNFYCRLNIEDIVLPLQVRTRKSGDKMKVKGLNGTKKIKDIFIDSKIPMKQRDLWPVVTDASGKVVWLPGLKKSKFDVPKGKNCDIILKYY